MNAHALAPAVLLSTLLVVPVLAEDVFPVTVEHALGSTVIEAKPERVVTWGWSAQDVVIDLGIAPVGMPFFAYGGGADGLLPWTEEALAEAGMDIPVILPNATEPPIEAIAALAPDIIIAPYSGLTPDEYALLSNIAPVVAYPDRAWFASWQDIVTLTGRALGLSTEAEALVEETETFLVSEIGKYPDAAGTVFANIVNRNDGQVAVRLEGDPRVQLFADIGLVPAPPPEGAVLNDTGIAYYVSYENFDIIPAKMLLSFFNDQQSTDEFFAMDLIKLSPLVAKGAYTRIIGEDITMAVSGAVTPVSLRWGFPTVAAEVGRAAAAAKAE
ncbi:iron complex transport system substrate-binding protein [Devosia crocina]|uniref:Iron complex transport system substrate-binding protein n=1 Tax=Devosia crocina TaxID=429728 RepID=A0A1I7NJG9_9HYPH|nr:ABC transporter substrate-binding protein [Devosia crocina]SFV34800.1 iron complex transport system substrate-binding protein [Devosia crocina]